MNRVGSSRRGLSTIVTTAVMLSAVAVLGSAVVSWSNGNLKAYETALSTTAATNTNKINEFLIVENVWYCKSICPSIPVSTTPPAINITLTNKGNIAVSITDIKIVNSSKTIDIPVNNVKILPSKSYSWQTTYYSYSNVPINIYTTTAHGSIFTTQVAPP